MHQVDRTVAWWRRLRGDSSQNRAVLLWAWKCCLGPCHPRHALIAAESACRQKRQQQLYCLQVPMGCQHRCLPRHTLLQRQQHRQEWPSQGDCTNRQRAAGQSQATKPQLSATNLQAMASQKQLQVTQWCKLHWIRPMKHHSRMANEHPGQNGKQWQPGTCKPKLAR